MLKTIDAGALNTAYLDHGPAGGEPVVVLLHGFPYDVHAFDEVTKILTAGGCRVLTPYLRGFGPTRFLVRETCRSGQQAALASDVIEFMNALAIPRAVLAGFDWGGRAACVVAALWPQRVRGLVSVGGYNIQDIAASVEPQLPENEYRLWYQYYFHGERGRAGLAQNRDALCRLLWRLWSPTWDFGSEVYERTAAAFTNPDFVDVVIHSYRHRFGLVPGAPEYDEIERRLAAQPKIAVPTIGIDGAADGVFPLGGSQHHERFFSGRYERRVLDGVGHNVPQEAPEEFASAVLSLF